MKIYNSRNNNKIIQKFKIFKNIIKKKKYNKNLIKIKIL